MTDEQAKQILTALRAIESKLGAISGSVLALVLATYLVAFSATCAGAR